MDLQYFLNVYDAAQPDRRGTEAIGQHGAKWTDGDRGVVCKGRPEDQRCIRDLQCTIPGYSSYVSKEKMATSSSSGHRPGFVAYEAGGTG